MVSSKDGSCDGVVIMDPRMFLYKEALSTSKKNFFVLLVTKKDDLCREQARIVHQHTNGAFKFQAMSFRRKKGLSADGMMFLVRENRVVKCRSGALTCVFAIQAL